MLIKHLLPAAALVALTACSTTENCGNAANCSAPKAKKSCTAKTLAKHDNADFYKDGKFDESAAKDAMIEMMKFYGYPVAADTKDKLWVSDYGTGRFAEVGLGAIMVKNNERDRYMIQPLFLLPGQMLPEHWHEKPEGDAPAKMEGWYVLYGYTYAGGEGEDNLAKFPEVKLPASHPGGVTAKHLTKILPTEYGQLNKVLEHHWQFAGPQGAIMIEVANLHTGSCVKHLVPAINAHFSK